MRIAVVSAVLFLMSVVVASSQTTPDPPCKGSTQEITDCFNKKVDTLKKQINALEAANAQLARTVDHLQGRVTFLDDSLTEKVKKLEPEISWRRWVLKK